MTETDPDLSGEAKLRKKRSRFFRYLSLAFLVSLIVGAGSGALVSAYEDGEVTVWVPILIWFVALVGLVWFSIDYFRRVDELDLLDNLWAHLIGMYAGVTFFAGWYLLADLALVPDPSALAVVGFMLSATFVAYGLRKAGLR